MDAPPNHGLLALAVLIYIPLFFTAVLWTLSRWGWRRFASDWSHATFPAADHCHVFQCLFGRWLSYNNAVVVAFTAAGIHLRTACFFRLFHAPLLIPWAAVTSTQEQPSWFGNYREFLIHHGPDQLTLRIASRRLERLGVTPQVIEHFRTTGP
jgi:hypothetical protein